MIVIRDDATPYAVAHKLITATVKAKNLGGEECDVDAYSYDELERIAKHILSYIRVETGECEEE